MPVKIEEIKSLIKEAIPDAQISIQDLAGLKASLMESVSIMTGGGSVERPGEAGAGNNSSLIALKYGIFRLHT